METMWHSSPSQNTDMGYDSVSVQDADASVGRRNNTAPNSSSFRDRWMFMILDCLLVSILRALPVSLRPESAETFGIRVEESGFPFCGLREE